MEFYIKILNNADYKYVQIDGNYHHFYKNIEKSTIFHSIRNAELKKIWLEKHGFKSEILKNEY